MERMSEPEARAFVGHNIFGMLGLANGGRAYTLPLFYGWDGHDFYFQTSPGLKVDYVDATQEACLTIARVVSLDDWASVQAFGPLEEVQGGMEGLAAMGALMTVPLPPRWGVSEFGEPLRARGDTLLYRLRPRRMSGRYSRPRKTGHGEEMAVQGM